MKLLQHSIYKLFCLPRANHKYDLAFNAGVLKTRVG